jgi:cytochrome P450
MASDLQTWAYAGIVAVVCLIAMRCVRKDPMAGIPIVQGGLPFIGMVATMIKGSPWDTMTGWMLKYGKVYRFRLFGSLPLVVADPALLKVILSTKLSSFRKDVDWTYKPFMVLLGKGLVTSEGSSWRSQRVLLAAHLRVDILEDVPEMSKKAFLRLARELQEAKAKGTVVEMAEEFRHLTLHVITEAVLSLPAEESDRTFAKMYIPIVMEGNLRTWNPERTFIPTPAWFKFRQDVKNINDYVTGLIEKRRQLRAAEEASGKKERKMDVLDKILDAVPGDECTKEVLSQIRDQMKTFILAGHETSASMLTWALYELSCNKTLHQKVRNEAEKCWKGYYDKKTCEFKSLPPRDHLDKHLTYTECCLRESLRKYSNVPSVVRVATADVKHEDYFIPKGTTVMLDMQGVHHNPEFWPEPLVYKPERFLSDIKPYTFVPFTEGPRMCIGQYLSLLESKTVLSLLVLSFDFEVTNHDTAGLKHPFLVPIIPKDGHFMKIK